MILPLSTGIKLTITHVLFQIDSASGGVGGGVHGRLEKSIAPYNSQEKNNCQNLNTLFNFAHFSAKDHRSGEVVLEEEEEEEEEEGEEEIEEELPGAVGGH